MTTTPPNWRTSLENNLLQHAHLPFSNFVQMATVRPDGRPANRTLTFRFFISEDRLLFTADARTEKTQQINCNPWAEACWYFTESRTQFRLSGKLNAVVDSMDQELVQTRQRTWHERTDVSRQSFTWPAAGKPLSASESFSQPCPAQAPETFALLIFTPERVERLNLHSQPHERIIFTCEQDGWLEQQINP